MLRIVFQTPFGNFYYIVISFRLKNASATYQFVMTVVFRDMIGNEVQDCANDLVVKSRMREGHWETLARMFEIQAQNESKKVCFWSRYRKIS